MKKNPVTSVLLQLIVSITLLGFGYLLEYRGENVVSHVPMLLMMVPGVVLLINLGMNFLTYPTSWAFPAITGGLCLIGFIGVILVFKVELNLLLVVLMLFVLGVTTVIGTCFHLLHGKTI